MSNCLFCAVYDRSDNPLNPEDSVLAESEFFFLKPALGQFVDGYCLVVAKEHYRTVAEMPTAAMRDLTLFYNLSISRLAQWFESPVIAFEHGAACPAERMGSCIDHAHIHLVPTSARANVSLEGLTECALPSFEDIHRLAAENSYLFYEVEGQKRLWVGAQHLPSQFMRRKLAESIELAGQWDWRYYPFRERVEAFCRLFRARIADEGQSQVRISA